MKKLFKATPAEFEKAELKIEMIMETVGGKAELWGCRGEGKGCTRNKYRARSKHCEDCLLADNPNETLEEFEKRLRRGN